MRLALTAVLVIGLSAVGAAQSTMPHSAGLLPRPTIGLPLPPIGLPLPQIGLPLPRIGLPPIGLATAPVVQHRGPAGSRVGPRVPSRARRPTVAYVIPTVGLGYPALPGYPGVPMAPAAPEPPTGSVRLDLQPGVVPQVFVDGYYVGTLDDFNGELTMEPGPHNLALHADGYEDLAFGVQIAAGRSITYQGTLRALPMPPPPARASADIAPPATIYVIPGCYVGNVPPNEVKLPTGCDAASVTTLDPLKR